jgi:hypothetical protein
MRQDGIDFDKSGRSVACFYILSATEIHEIADIFKLIHRNDTAQDRSCQDRIF